MLNTIVCDDELPALQLMTDFLVETGGVSIVSSCQSVREALDIINSGGVDLVVLDIEMPELSGVDAYNQISVEPRPLVIFATAHPEYAVEAFGVDAIDYILKPISLNRVSKAVEKAERLRRLIVEREAGSAIDAPETVPAEAVDVLKIKDAGKLYFVPHNEIVWIEAAGDYSLLHLKDRELTIRVPIKSLEADLTTPNFARVHRSAIVSARHIREITLLPKGEAMIVLDEDTSVRSSRSYRDAVQALAGGK